MAGNTINVPLASRQVHARVPSLPIAVPSATRHLTGHAITIPAASIAIPTAAREITAYAPVVTSFSIITVKVTVMVDPSPRTFIVTRQRDG